MEHDKQLFLQSLRAYVPGFIVQQIIANPTTILAGHEERHYATVLFADVSGFTPMSEKLAKLGKEGAEELTRVLNDYFDTMIKLVRQYGGQIIKFGGDAMTCAFVGRTDSQLANQSSKQVINQSTHDEPTRPFPQFSPLAPINIDSSAFQHSLWQACACGLAMQQEMSAFKAVQTRGGVFELKMKIGISAGPVLFLSVGDPDIGLEYVLAGRALDRMAEAEHHATVGEVVVDGAPLALLNNTPADLGLIAGEQRDTFFLLTGLIERFVRKNNAKKAFIPKGLSDVIDWQIIGPELVPQLAMQLMPYVPATVYEQIMHGQPQFVGEHRRVVSLFVNFTGLQYDDDPQAGAKLQGYFKAMQAIIHRYGGRLNRVITGDKGNLLHLIFGAPVAHEDNERRAVGAALAMQQRLTETTNFAYITSQRIGLASGYVFAGNVGSNLRREYTVMGDVVNLSARLMQASEAGQILMDLDTAQQVDTAFDYDPLEPIKVKGKEHPIPIARPIGLKAEAKIWGMGQTQVQRGHLPIVGRDAEIDRMQTIINQVMAGQGQLLTITGEAGVGKSRLLEELITLARPHNMVGLGGYCVSYGAQSPYLPWLDFFTAFFNLQDIHDPIEKHQRIETRMIEANPTFKEWVPLMAQLMGLDVPDNELIALLDAQLRKQRIFDITLELLRYQAQQSPLFLLVFEDVHWIDTISLEMLEYVARNIHDQSILLVVLYRPTIDLSHWMAYDYYHQFPLLDISIQDALTLMQYKLGLSAIPETLKKQIIRGQERLNPFFVEEVINTLIDNGYLAARSDEAGYELVGDISQIKLPNSIQALVMSRIDRLDESSKLTVKVASVIGRTFKYQTLAHIYPIEILTDQLHQNLERLNSLDLTPLDRPAPEWEYIFKHIITRDVAYESLLYVHRRTLHEQVAHYLEQAHEDSLMEYYELLAHHYGQSGNKDKSWYYLTQAGHRAKTQYANEAAINHYQTALALNLNKPDRYQIHQTLGDIYRLIGQYDQAVTEYQQVFEFENVATTFIADTRRRIAKTWEQQGRYDEALSYLQKTETMLDDMTQTAELAHLYNDMGWIANQRGDYKQALQLCHKGLQISAHLTTTEKQQQVRDKLQHTIGTIYMRTSEYTEAIKQFNECIELRRKLGDLDGESRSFNNLAIVYWSQGNYDLAAECMGKSLEITQKIGDIHGMAMGYNNLGVIYYTRNDYTTAIAHYQKSLEIRQKIGDLQGIADSYTNLGEVYHTLEDYQHALEYLQKATIMFKDMSNKEALLDAYKLLAEIELALENNIEALDYAQQALNLAQEIEQREYEAIAHRVLGQVTQAIQKMSQAHYHLQTSVEILSATGNKLELGKSHYEFGLLLKQQNEVVWQHHVQQAIDIFDALGVEAELDKAKAVLSSAE